MNRAWSMWPAASSCSRMMPAVRATQAAVAQSPRGSPLIGLSPATPTGRAPPWQADGIPPTLAPPKEPQPQLQVAPGPDGVATGVCGSVGTDVPVESAVVAVGVLVGEDGCPTCGLRRTPRRAAGVVARRVTRAM